MWRGAKSAFVMLLPYRRAIVKISEIIPTVKEIIRKLGERGKCVIVGRNANSILKDFDNSLHVFVHADQYWRAARLQKEKMPDKTEKEILDDIKIVDKRRQKYCSHYTNTEFGVSKHYDLCLSTSSLGIDKCVQIILDVARG